MRNLIAALAVLALLTGCGPQDKPLPFSLENSQKFSDALLKEVKSTAPTPSQDGDMAFLDINKKVIEKDLGYSFDKTVRNAFVSPTDASTMLMENVFRLIKDNPKSSLDKGLISQRTFDIFDAAKNAKFSITSDEEKFLSFVSACQDSNGGTCDSTHLIPILIANKVNWGSNENTPTDGRISARNGDLYFKFNVSEMGNRGWITQPDGSVVSTVDWVPNVSYIVNKAPVELSRKYTQMIAAEKQALSSQ